MNDYEKYLCKLHHLNFMQTVWRNRAEPLVVGLHTRAICNLIDKAVNDFDEGKSTFLIINVPPRHGKSDMISKYEPVHFMAMHPDKDVMVVSYNSSLAIGHSKFSRDLMTTDAFKEIFPNVQLSSKSSASDSWGVEGGIGIVTASGLSSGITGKGYHFGILDDYCAGRAEAESKIQRDTMWDSFVNDFFTRRAPVSITIILATPWHVDDIVGRIKSKIDPTQVSYDKDFPKFTVVKFPAKNGTAHIVNNKGEDEEVKYDYLFTEHTLSTGEVIKGRFSPEYYESAFSTLGRYGAQALMQCEPTVKGGNLIDTSKIKVHNDVKEFPLIKYYRVWDLAHTAKQRMGDDPDWTAGTLLGFRNVNGITELWVKDVAHFREDVPKRNLLINAISEKDSQSVSIGIECSLDARDTIRTMQEATRGRRRIIPIKTQGDKVARMSYLEPIFEAGNVHILRGDWNFEWLNELNEFPSGKHDDQVDNLSAGYAMICQQKTTMEKLRTVGV